MTSESVTVFKRCCSDVTPIKNNTNETIFCDDVINCSSAKRYKIDANIRKLNENIETPIARSRVLLQVSSEARNLGLSPISEITNNLSDTSIGTPQTGKCKSGEKGDTFPEDTFGLKFDDLGSLISRNEEEDNNKKKENISTKSTESLISNSFTLSSGGRNNAGHRMESRIRLGQRRLNITPLTLTFKDDDDDHHDHDDDDNDDNRLHENIISPERNCNRMAIDDISFYSSQSPQQNARPCPSSPLMNIGLLSPEGSPQRFTVVQNTVTIVDKNRSIIDEIDGSSVDSGYGTSSFKFIAPKLPKKLEPSPRKPYLQDHMKIQIQQIQHDQRERKTSPPKSYRIFHSLSSGSTESMEDDIMELFDSEQFDEDISLPSNLNSLISGHIMTVKTPEMKRPPVRRCLSLTENNTLQQARRSALFEPKTPEILKIIPDNKNLTPFTSRNVERCFKRPDPPSISPVQTKRYKFDEKENRNLNNDLEKFTVARTVLRKSVSLNEAQIMTALARSTSEPDLIGDFSKPFCLPLMDGRHQDLKSISCETMAQLILGEFNSTVGSFKIIDCRYPYEYDGGHICGAQNLYTHEQIVEELVNSKTEAPEVQEIGPKRHILVFHCEFSSERGPKLSRFLRNRDRSRNSHKYPALHYPEIYLLHGGYKEFYEKFSTLCDPIAYRPMLDPSFGADYRQFRAKSKSWNGDIIKAASSGTTNRLVKSRSRLVL